MLQGVLTQSLKLQCVQSVILKAPRHTDQLLNYTEFSFQWVFGKDEWRGKENLYSCLSTMRPVSS